MVMAKMAAVKARHPQAKISGPSCIQNDLLEVSESHVNPRRHPFGFLLLFALDQPKRQKRIERTSIVFRAVSSTFSKSNPY